jgi:hypothetical protein
LSLVVGKPKGRIAKRELATLPDGAFYRVDEKAWFNKQVMLDWIKVILAPWAAKRRRRGSSPFSSSTSCPAT